MPQRSLRNILPPQVKNMTYKYKFRCGCECCIAAKSLNSSLLTWRDRHMKHFREKSHNTKNRKSGELSSCLYETYKNVLKLHACHIHCTAADMDMAKMCPCPLQHNGIPHWKCILRCCKKLSSLIISSLDTNKDATGMCSAIQFHVYRNVSRCTMHGQCPQ